MRLASYNVENLFNRAKVMNSRNWSDGKSTLAQYSELNSLLGETEYTTSMKKRMVRLVKELGLGTSDKGPFVILRKNRGQLLKRTRGGGLTIVADGRADWVGSLELIEAPIEHESMLNTARVIRDVNADILGVVEAENRPALKLFNDKIVAAVDGEPYAHVMLIDGNDDRGIDVGLLTRDHYSINTMRSHVDDRLPDGNTLFSRDCPEYRVGTPTGHELLVLVNHFKSKGYGTPAESDAKRKAQARRVREIYETRLAEGNSLIAVLGDLNDTPVSDPLKPLHANISLKDVFTHDSFENGDYPGTYGLCNAGNKIDYIFLSPHLFAKVRNGGVWRKGMWPGSRPRRWEAYPEVTRPGDAGSDHAAVWVDIEL